MRFEKKKIFAELNPAGMRLEKTGGLRGSGTGSSITWSSRKNRMKPATGTIGEQEKGIFL